MCIRDSNATEMYVFRLRSFQDLGAFLDEVSALVNKKALLQMYELATSEPYSFLYVKMTSKSKKNMFMIRFDKYLEVEEAVLVPQHF